MKRIVVVQKMLPPYREEFFRRLDLEFSGRGWSLGVIHITPQRSSSVTNGNDSMFRPLTLSRGISLKIRGVRESLVVPSGLSSLLNELSPKGIVCGDLNDLPSGMLCRRYAVRNRIPYLIWGLGNIPGKKRSVLRRTLSPVIRRFHGDAAAFLGYSDFAATHYRETTGKPVYPVYNSCVRATVGDEREELLRRIARKYTEADDQLKVIYIGALTPQKKVSLLIRAVARMGNARLQLYIVGDGPLRRELEGEAKRLGIEKQVAFHGDVRDERRKRELFDAAHVGVLPGLGGLALQELQAQGIPVICSYADGCELDLVRNPTPKFFIEQLDENTLAGGLIDFIGMEPKERIQSAYRALSVVEEKYNLDAMAVRFADAVLLHAAHGG